MSKRSPSPKLAPDCGKRVRIKSALEEEWDIANTEINSWVTVQTAKDPERGRLLPQVVSMIALLAPPETRLKLISIPESKTLFERNPGLQGVLETAMKHGDYTSVASMLSTIPEAVIDDTLDPGPSGSGRGGEPRTASGAAVLAWNCPYRGRNHVALLENINMMDREGSYSSAVSIIQSSGTGKSRMVHELADIVFTIPFNLRRSNQMEDYPPADMQVANYLCNPANFKNVQHCEECVARFFYHLFSLVVEEVKRVFGTERRPPCEVAHRWRDHMQGTNRSQLYTQVVDACEKHDPIDSSPAASKSLDTSTKFVELCAALTHLSDFPNSKDVKIILYFDEAHELCGEVPGTSQPRKTLYDIVWSSLDHFQDSAVFTIFLSTQSSISLLAPSANAARSSRQQNTKMLPAPITELPFDCHPMFPLQAGQFKLEDLGQLSFLARFGRPLFWTMIEASSENNNTVISNALRLARKKLLNADNIHAQKHSNTAMLAILDQLVTIDYEPKRELVSGVEAEMVASHMRIVFSVPDHRVYIRSGYPSEPFLAEAASRQMHHYLLKGNRVLDNRMIRILALNLNTGLIDAGQRGEVVMRILLWMAHMHAITGSMEPAALGPQLTREPNFSTGCNFLTFLRALFPECLHSLILRSRPDNNWSSHETLEEAFGDAVVRFTHFIKAADSAVVETSTMAFAFMRTCAFICHSQQKGIDIIIPILLNGSSKLVESSMSALLIQVKRRQKAGSVNAYTIDANVYNFFPQDDARPYITLVAELGVDSPKVETGKSSERSSARTKKRNINSRYSIRAYGCTDETWRVIDAAENDEYKQVLATDDFLQDHPRQNQVSKELVQAMLPHWCPTWYEDPTSSST
ncbi:hypothetical protein EDC04DRAFT_3065254 [Pisolithus marmoratus]|nr:hypothetical protein EDC04DRAFT_3065254 [Pisolithus marmoratus]